MSVLSYREFYEGEPHAAVDIMYGTRQKLYSRDRNHHKEDRDLEIVTGDLSFSIWKSEYIYACVFWYNGELVLRYAEIDREDTIEITKIGMPNIICAQCRVDKLRDWVDIDICGNVMHIVDNEHTIEITTGFNDEADYMEWNLKR